MKEKFLRIISPISLAVICVIDIAVIGYGIFAIQKIIQNPRSTVIIFTALEAIALIIAILVTKETVSNGIKFYDDEMEFTGIDNDNIFSYDSIEKVETQKDEKPSFVKNFIDRQSQVILTLKDDKVVTIALGITTKKTLNKVEEEINSRINK